MPSFVTSFAVLTAIFLVVAGAELVPRLRRAPRLHPRPWLHTDIAWYLVAALSAGLSGILLRPVLEPLVLPGLDRVVGDIPDAARLILAVVLFDGLFFAIHRRLHRSDVLWQVHKVHHSSRQLDVLATTRTHAFEHLARNVPAQLALVTLGFPTTTITAAVLIMGGFGALNHSNLRLPLGWLEWLLVTPRMHRLHHVPATTLTNYATVLSVWDRAAGSLQRHEAPAGTDLGVPGEVTTYPQAFGPSFREPARQLAAQRAGSALTGRHR